MFHKKIFNKAIKGFFVYNIIISPFVLSLIHISEPTRH